MPCTVGLIRAFKSTPSLAASTTSSPINEIELIKKNHHHQEYSLAKAQINEN